MTSTALARALSYDALNSSWKRLYNKAKPASRNTVGIDDRSINDFQIDAKGNVIRLRRAIASGDFTFSKLRPYLIPKPNGKKRLICVPTVEDRIVQGALVDFLAEKYTKVLNNQVSYGFLRGRGVSEAVQAGRILRDARPFVFKTDITAFFDSIPREQLQKQVAKVIREKSLYQIIFQAISSEVQVPNLSVKRDLSALGIVTGKGLRQGMPLSPVLSNILLLGFDQKLHKSGFRAIRYADDLVFFCMDEDECYSAARFCTEEFGKLGLSIPEIGPGSKSCIYQPEESAEFLGLELASTDNGYVLKASREQIDRMRQDMLSFSSIVNVVNRGITLKNLSQVLASKRSGYLGAYAECVNSAHLESVLVDAENKAIRTLFGTGLGIDTKRIGAVGRTFLGLL